MSKRNTREENVAVVEQFVTEIYERGNVAALDDLLANEFVFKGVEGTVTDRTDLAASYSRLHESWETAFPDLTFTIEDTIANEAGVAIRLSQSGTFEGPYMDMEPTGNSFDISVMEMFHLEDGKIVERHAVRDRQEFLSQIRADSPDE